MYLVLVPQRLDADPPEYLLCELAVHTVHIIFLMLVCDWLSLTVSFWLVEVFIADFCSCSSYTTDRKIHIR